MSEPNLDYTVLRNNIEPKVQRQKWLYRRLFLVMHLIFFAVSMLVVWGTLSANAPLHDLLFNTDSGAGIIVVLPTILWSAVVFFHIASLFFESKAGENAIRKQLLAREIGEAVMRTGLTEDGMAQKPKRHAVELEDRRMMLSDEGELIPVDEEESFEQDHYYTRATETRRSRQDA